jgi:hypothetical protein
MAKRFKYAGRFLEVDAAHNIENPRRHAISLANYRDWILCSGCNTFFKHLEDQVANTVEWMARGRSMTLDTEQLALLACWGAKTGIALLSVEREFRDLVPLEHREHLREREIPHDDCWVGYASWNGSIHGFAGEQAIGDTPDPRPGAVYRAYSLVFTIERLALKLFGLIDGPVPGYAMSFDTDSLRQFWPPRHLSLAWPLFPATQEGNLPNLIDLAPMEEARGM